jgi:DNA mismatch repair ATPase MutL
MFHRHHIHISEALSRLLGVAFEGSEVPLPTISTTKSLTPTGYNQAIGISSFDEAFLPCGNLVDLFPNDDLKPPSSSISFQTSLYDASNNVDELNLSQYSEMMNCLGTHISPTSNVGESYETDLRNASSEWIPNKRKRLYSPNNRCKLSLLTGDLRTVTVQNYFDTDLNDDFCSSEISREYFHRGNYKNENNYSDVVLNKDCMSEFRLIGQADAKYIVAMLDNNIVCIDQHAADERIILESFPKIQDEFLTSMKLIKTDIRISLSQDEFFCISNGGKDTLAKWGFQLDVQNDPNLGILRSLPIILDETLTVDDFNEFLREICKNYPSNLSVIPPAMKRIYASKACRSAVKFGDILSTDKCEQILRKLSKAKFPFSW